MKFLGTVKNIEDPLSGVSKQGKEWKKQAVLIEGEGQYPDSLVIEWFNKDINFEVGDQIEVEFNARANEYKGKHFNALGAWKWEVVSSAQTSGSMQEQMPSNDYGITTLPSASEQYGTQSDDVSDALPF
jgi:hypothetical protein